MASALDVRLLLLWNLGILLFLIGMWNIDLFVSSEQWKFVSGVDADHVFSNGWYSLSPAKAYHISLYCEYIGFSLVCFLFVFCFVRTRNVNN